MIKLHASPSATPLNEEYLLSETNPSQESKPDARPSPPKTFYRDWVEDWWLFELLSLALGTCAIIAICITLAHYQDRPAPGLNSVMGVGITLNTIIAILSTVGRASLLLPVAECISQQKWAWFSDSAKPLTEIDMFEQGSRGAWGSVILIWKIHVRQIVSVGAFVLILALVVDPLSQQLVRYDLQMQADPSSSAYVSTALTWQTTTQTSGYFNQVGNKDDMLTYVQDPPLHMKAAVQNGFLTSQSILNDTQPFCSTGNCTWPVYRSLAVCARWQDVSSHLKKTETRDKARNSTMQRWSLTNRHYIESDFVVSMPALNMSSAAKPKAFDDSPEARNALNFQDSIAYADNPMPLADIFLLYVNQSKPAENPYSAIELLFEWCVQEFSTKVVNGTAFTTRQASTNKFTGGADSLTGPLFNSTTDFGSGPQSYSVENKTHFILSNYLRKVFDGSVKQIDFQYYKTSDAAEAFHQRLWPESTRENPRTDARIQAGMKEISENIAISMTNIVRDITRGYSGMGGNKNLTDKFMTAHGTAWREQAFVRVRWGWIAAPILLVVLSVLFVVVTILQSGRQAKRYKTWKSSSLATLIALSEELHQHVGGLGNKSENENTLDHTRAMLRQNSDGKWRLQGT